MTRMGFFNRLLNLDFRSAIAEQFETDLHPPFHPSRQGREINGSKDSPHQVLFGDWIPAFAGMTERKKQKTSPGHLLRREGKKRDKSLPLKCEIAAQAEKGHDYAPHDLR